MAESMGGTVGIGRSLGSGRRLAMVALAVAALSGCAAINDMERSSDNGACSGFGFRPGTDAYANCMMQQSSQRDAEDQRTQDRFQLQQAADKISRSR